MNYLKYAIVPGMLVSQGVASLPTLDSYLADAVTYANTRIENSITSTGVGATKVSSTTDIEGNIQAALSTGVGGTPSNWCPNYQYSWVRDQALVMTTIVDKYELAEAGSSDSVKYETILKSYASHPHTVYSKNDNPLWYTSEGRPWSHAEAKYELNGQMYIGGWCSPQNDGPALRSVVLMRFANRYKVVHPEDTTYISENLYQESTNVGVKNPIKRDLEFLYQYPVKVATNPDRYTGYWDSDNCEPWEEVSGKHFYNRLMARRALSFGSEFAQAQGDSEASKNYASALSSVESALDTHWDSTTNQIKPTNNNNRYDDIQTTLGVLHSYPELDGYYGPTSSRVLADAYYTLHSFEDYFNLNKIGYDDLPLTAGLAVGRYTGDVYNGGCTYSSDVCPSPCGGQPWFLATNAMGELIYRAVSLYKDSSIIVDSTNKKFFEFFNIRESIGTYEVGTETHQNMLIVLIHAADSFIKRTQLHTDSKYRLDEQFNADTGVMMSAGDLVWSYASLVTAKQARDELDPSSTISNFGNSTTVKQEFIISDYDLTYDSNKSVYRVVGDVSSLGNMSPCSSGYESRTPSARRCRDGACDYTLLVDVPKNTQIKWAMARTNADCTSYEIAPVSQIISATNNGLEASSASWNHNA